ncbi:MAG: hypothetical protein ACYC2T_09890 [Bacillota bacterium]
MEKKIARISFLVYTGLSLALVLIFLMATYLNGIKYPPVARFGGTVWVFILSMIIMMPIVIPAIKKRYQS